MRSIVRRLVPALIISLIVPVAGSQTVFAAPTEDAVLILASTVADYYEDGSLEQQAAEALGLEVDVVGPDAWAAMTTADFAAYRAVILGDPFCGYGTEGYLEAAEANAATWASAATGNVVIIGTDDVFHSYQGGQKLIEKGIAFAVADRAKTGAYITLSCYYDETSPNTPVPLLDGFGDFTVTGVGCYNNAHIVATHAALDGLTDADLSEWSCSVHEAFDSWPDAQFEVLAIAKDFGAVFTAPDGSQGTPYILARGVRVISDITLAPDSAKRKMGANHTLSATIVTDGAPVPSKTVTFTVIDGPHTGTTGTGVTNAQGVATFSYTGTDPGTDTVHATFVDGVGHKQRSNRVTVDWLACAEDGLDALHGSALTGTASGTVHDSVEPVVEGINADAAATVHQVNCDVVTSVEDAIDGAA